MYYLYFKLLLLTSFLSTSVGIPQVASPLLYFIGVQGIGRAIGDIADFHLLSLLLQTLLQPPAYLAGMSVRG